MKISSIVIASLVSIGVAGAAQAQFAVIDFANLTQALLQVNAWKQQYEQMANQYSQLRKQYDAVTGSRNLGDIANNPALQGVVPADVAELYAGIQSRGAAAMSPAARALRDRSKIYDCEDRHGADLVNCQALLANNAQLQALGQSALFLVERRGGQIRELQSQINATSDVKAIGELQARLQVEATQVGNDANRLMLMKMLADGADRGAQQAIKEKELQNLSLASDGSDTFVYVPFSRRH
jgi:type IV secretion system protein VirB5